MAAKSLFITGASSGIGAATARAAVAQGWHVGLFARSADRLGALADELGPAAHALPGDVTALADLESAIASFAQHADGLVATFANAGSGVKTPGTMGGDPEEWRRVVDLNVMGVLYTVRASLAYLKQSRGHLVLTGSGAGRHHIPGSVYGATKWFVHGYAGNIAAEMEEWGGRCTLVAPGQVDTAFFDTPRPGRLQPEDVAEAVMHALDAHPRNTVREIHLTPRA